MAEISFEQEIADLEAELENERRELERLQAEWDEHALEFDELRESLRALRATTNDGDGAAPRTKSSPLKIELNPDTGRPPRGARREQIEAICRRLGRGGETFRTVDVLNTIRDVDGDVSSGVRSYTYAMMKTLGDEDVVRKVDRGMWELAGGARG